MVSSYLVPGLEQGEYRYGVLELIKEVAEGRDGIVWLAYERYAHRQVVCYL